MEILDQIYDGVIDGDAAGVETGLLAAIEAGLA